MNTQRIAEAVKNHLIDLALKDKLPLDMNDLSVSGLEKAIKKGMPTPKEMMLEKAGEYLSFDTEDELIHMIKLIANAKDEHELIDNVDDDICVWEKLEWSLNVKEFMQLIGYKKGLLD
jgi:hypothetical protein